MKKLGFIIANDGEEFLSNYSADKGSIARSWAMIPDFAMVFRTRQHALKAVEKLEYSSRLYVLELHENNMQYAVAAYEEEDPPLWLMKCH